MKELTPEDITDRNNTNSVELEVVKKWLADAGITATTHTSTTHFAHKDWQKTLPFPFDEQSYIDGKFLKAIARMCIEAKAKSAQDAQDKKTGLDSIPESYAWLKEKLSEENGLSLRVAEGNKLSVWNSDYPELRMTFVLGQQRNPEKLFDQQFGFFKTQLALYKDSVANLEMYGFEFKRDKEKLIISQPDYNLVDEVPFNHNNKIDPFKVLSDLELKANDVFNARDAKLQELKSNGFTVYEKILDNGTKIGVIRHAEIPDKTFQITLHGDLDRIDSAGLRQIEAAHVIFDHFVKKPYSSAAMPSSSDIAADQAPVKRPVVRVITEDSRVPPLVFQKPDLPPGQKASLIFDTSSLTNLEAKRGGGRTWIDILPITAALPTVDKLYIPASVADFELRGGITVTRPGGSTEFQVVDPKTAEDSHKYNSGARELLAKASRFVRDADGKGHLIEGKNPNIIIYESSIDRQLVDAVTNITGGKPVSRGEWDKIDQIIALRERPFNDGGLKNFGEHSMEAVAQEIPNKGPVFLVADDIEYLMHRTEITTKDGFPVGEAKTVGYLNAAIAAHGNDIAVQLEQKYPDAPVGKIDIKTIEKQVLQLPQWQKHSVLPNGYPASKAFAYMTEDQGRIPGESLESIFRRGSAMQHGDKAEYNFPLPSTLTSGQENFTGKPAYRHRPVKETTFSAIPPAPQPPLPPAAKVITETHEPSPHQERPDEVAATVTAITAAAAVAPVVAAAAEEPAHESEAKDKKVLPAPPPVSSPQVEDKTGLISAEEKRVAAPVVPPLPAEHHDFTVHPTEPVELPYEQTLGYKIGYHRIARNMTEGDLAQAVKTIAIHRPEVDEQSVRMWETNRKMPEAELYEAIVHVLVTDNKHITDKEKVKEEFKDAYQRSMRAKEAKAEGRAVNDEDTFAFGDVLYKYRKETGLQDNAKFAEVLKGRIASGIEEPPEKIDAMLILKIDANAHHPSAGLMKAIVKVLDEKKPLSSEEKQEINGAFSERKWTDTVPRRGNKTRGHTEAVGRQNAPEQASTEVRELRGRLAEWLKENAPNLSVNKLSEKLDEPQSTMSPIFGAATVVKLSIRKEKLVSIGEKASGLFKELGIDEQKINQFNHIFNSLVEQVEKEKREAEASRKRDVG